MGRKINANQNWSLMKKIHRNDRLKEKLPLPQIKWHEIIPQKLKLQQIAKNRLIIASMKDDHPKEVNMWKISWKVCEDLIHLFGCLTPRRPEVKNERRATLNQFIKLLLRPHILHRSISASYHPLLWYLSFLLAAEMRYLSTRKVQNLLINITESHSGYKKVRLKF